MNVTKPWSDATSRLVAGPPCDAHPNWEVTMNPEVPPCIRRVLSAAVAGETQARGTARRHAFRTTRYLLGGCRSAGLSLTLLAAVLHVQPETIRARSTTDGVIAATTFAALADVSPEVISSWHEQGLLPDASIDEQRQTGYLASALITALLRA